MVFYNSCPLMQEKLEKVFIQLTEQGYILLKDSLSVSWLSYRNSVKEKPYGTAWAAKRLFHLGDLVNLFYAVAVEVWLQRQWLEEDIEIYRALSEMGSTMSSDATSMIIDLLTGTSGGLRIHDRNKQDWYEQRQLLNNWLRELDWPELAGSNICQKVWPEGTFGTERQFCGTHYQNRNRLSTGAMARFLHMLIISDFYSPLICQRIKSLFNLDLDIDPYYLEQSNTSEQNPMTCLNIISSKNITDHKLIFARTKRGTLNVVVLFNEDERISKDISMISSLLMDQLID
uniref:Beta-lactamase family protein n=1 Tax=Paulinella micropora TaxID=1928728 RepID=A0A385I0P0_9EUKA|nr:hypothetical protein PMNZ_555 [Paulinella micropora]AXY63491.1 hypothetical protein PMNZ_555 [Paulinella micropora]